MYDNNSRLCLIFTIGLRAFVVTRVHEAEEFALNFICSSVSKISYLHVNYNCISISINSIVLGRGMFRILSYSSLLYPYCRVNDKQGSSAQEFEI